MTEIRCSGKLHGIIIRDSVIEVKCRSRFCGAGKGVVVLHEFDSRTGEEIATRRFRNPKEVE